MNRNRHLSEKTYGKRNVQPHMSWLEATKKKFKFKKAKKARGRK